MHSRGSFFHSLALSASRTHSSLQDRSLLALFLNSIQRACTDLSFFSLGRVQRSLVSVSQLSGKYGLLQAFVALEGLTTLLIKGFTALRLSEGYSLGRPQAGASLLKLRDNVSCEVAIFGCVVGKVKGVQDHKV